MDDFAADFVMNPVEEEPSYGRAAIRDNIQRFASAWEDLEVRAERVNIVPAGAVGSSHGVGPLVVSGVHDRVRRKCVFGNLMRSGRARARCNSAAVVLIYDTTTRGAETLQSRDGGAWKKITAGDRAHGDERQLAEIFPIISPRLLAFVVALCIVPDGCKSPLQ